MSWSVLWNTSVFAGMVAKRITLPLIQVSPRTRGCEQRVGGWKGQMEGQIEGRGWVDTQGQMERQREDGVVLSSSTAGPRDQIHACQQECCRLNHLSSPWFQILGACQSR